MGTDNLETVLTDSVDTGDEVENIEDGTVHSLVCHLQSVTNHEHDKLVRGVLEYLKKLLDDSGFDLSACEVEASNLTQAYERLSQNDIEYYLAIEAYVTAALLPHAEMWSDVNIALRQRIIDTGKIFVAHKGNKFPNLEKYKEHLQELLRGRGLIASGAAGVHALHIANCVFPRKG